MKRLVMAAISILGAAVLLLANGDALAASGKEKQNVMLKMAEALAYQQTCHSIAIDQARMILLAMTFHVDLGHGAADQEAVMLMAKGKMLDLQSSSEETLCKAAMVLYGPDGLNGPGLLKEK